MSCFGGDFHWKYIKDYTATSATDSIFPYRCHTRQLNSLVRDFITQPCFGDKLTNTRLDLYSSTKFASSSVLLTRDLVFRIKTFGNLRSLLEFGISCESTRGIRIKLFLIDLSKYFSFSPFLEVVLTGIG